MTWTKRKIEGETLSVFPPKVEYESYERGTVYTTVLTIKNVASRVLAYRIKPPSLKQWTVNGSLTTVKLAPGLEAQVTVTFMSEEEKDITDVLLVSTDGSVVEVPLRALAPTHNVIAEGDLDMGVVAIEHDTERRVVLRNKGPRDAGLSLSYDKSIAGLKVELTRDTLGPVGSGEEATSEIVVKLRPEEAGMINTPVSIMFADSTPPIRMQLTAQAVQQTVKMVDRAGAAVTKLALGTAYLGHPLAREAVLVNQGPKRLRFRCHIIGGGDIRHFVVNGEVMDENELSRLGLPPSVRITPSQGVLEPFAQLPVKVEFLTEAYSSRKGFMSTLQSVDQDARNENSVFIVNFGQKSGLRVLQLPLTARAVRPGVKLDPAEVCFPDVPSGQHMEEMVKVHNLNQELPAVIEIPSSAYFHADQSRIRLEPGQTVTVVISYTPKSMGRHTARLSCPVTTPSGAFLQECVLSLQGQSLTHDVGLGTTKGPAGRAPLPEDFVKPRVFTAAQDPLMTNTKMAKTARPPLWEKEEAARQFFSYHRDVGTEHAYSLKETLQRAEHRALYDGQLRDARRRRQAQTTALPDPTDPVSLGLQQAAGLKEPAVTLPAFKDPLWLQDKIIVRPKHRPPLANDIRLLSKCRFKPRPETEKEKADCKTQLLGPDTAKVSACRYLDFGQVALGQSEVQHFAVTNGLSQNLLVKLDITEEDCDELEEITPKTQVVPPGATAAFSCRFTASNPGTFEYEVPYTINGQRYTFKTTADVVPVRVELNVEKLHFQFSPDNWTGRVDHMLGMENPFDFPVVFNVESTNNVFSVEPARGVLDPRGKLSVRVRWAPVANDTVGNNKGNLIVHVRGELKPKKVACQGELPEGRMQLVGEKHIDFDVVAVGVPKSKVVVLRNLAPHESQFQVLLANPALRASPTFGRVPAKGSLEIEITVAAEEPCAIEETLFIDVRGGRQIKVPTRGKVVVPDIFIEEDMLSFGGVIVGGTGKMPLTLVNGSPVQGAVVLDLTNHNEMSVELGRDAWSPEIYEHCPVQVIGQRGSERSIEAFSSERSIRRRSSIANQLFSPGSKYRITIMGNSKLPLTLSYKPTSVGSAIVPIGLLDSKGFPPPPQSRMARPIEATMSGLEPKLVLSDTLIDFGKRVVVRGSNVIPYSITLHMSSHSAEPIKFKFAVNEQCSPEDIGVFNIEPSEGVLAPETPLVLKVLFMPRESTSYNLRVPLYADGDMTSRYLELAVAGVGSMPRLMFDVEEVLLEPVPLGVKASAQVLVINDGYDNLDLKVKMPVDTDKIPISVDFPDGTMIGVAKERLPMVVSFIAYKPTSFTAAIELMDFEGARYRLPISGVSDNSVLSTSDFMTRNAKSLNIARGAGPRDVPKLLLAPGSDETSTSGLANVGPLEVNRFLPRYLNATTMLGPFTNLREDILASKGRTIIDIVEILSGKPVPGKATQLPASRREAMVMLLNQYEKLIQHLASLGALLNTTKPEFLLDADDFARLLSMRETQGGEDTIKDARLGLLFWEQVEANFPAVSTRAWNAVLAQVAKALVLSRCSVRGLKQAGVPVPKEMEKAWATSNVYSVPEMTLLAWVQHWYSKVFPSEPAGKLLRFDTDVNNGKVLYAVLVSHWPSLKAFKDRMLPEEDTSESKLHNAQVVVDMVKQLELPFFFTASELVEASCDEMVLLLVYLFQTLPQLAPKNSITFSARLGEVLTKYVELHNPSSMAVSYYARLEGHSDFALTSTTVFLEPHATVHFPVQCKSSISKPVSGFLVLSSRRDGTAHGSTLVFALQSQVNTSVPVQKATVDGTTYQMEVAEIEVRNPFPGDCDFTIQLEQHMQNDNKKRRQRKEQRARGGQTTKTEEGNGLGDTGGTTSNLQRPYNPDARSVIAQGQPLQVMSDRYPHGFGCERQRLRLRQGAVDRLDLVFLPFLPGTHVCHIVLEDAHFGKFQVEVIGNAKLPPPVSKLTYQCDQEGPVVQDISIPFSNNLCEAAKRLFLERHPLAKDDKQTARLKALDMIKGEPVVYTVEQHNQFVSVPRVVVLKGMKNQPEKGGRSGEDEGGGSTNSVRVELNPKGAGLYPVKVKLTSVNDVRVYDLTFEATKAGTVSKLEFDCPARHQVQQEIPLVNHGDKPLQVRANIQGETFFGPAQLSIDPGLTLMYPLSFRTNAPGNYYGKLELQIPATGELNIYELRGTASAPLAEQHLELSCQARTETSVLLSVPNIKQTSTSYQVLADLPFMTGEPSLDVPPGGKATYELKIKPPRSGKYLGSVMFSIDKNNYVWFTLDLDIQTPPSTDSLSVRCGVREAVQLDIPLENPVDRPVTFTVAMEGAAIFGPKTIAVGAFQSATYRLFCSPLVAGKEECKVRFNNEELGEFWYAVEVEAMQPQPTQMELTECELGKAKTIEIPFSNPLGQDVQFAVTVDNTASFAPVQHTVTVPAFGEGIAQISYAPCELGSRDDCLVRVSHKRAGLMEFHVPGTGVRPGVMDECVITSVVGQSGTGMVVWVNPFRTPAMVDLDLVEDGMDPSLKILLKRAEGVVVNPGAALQVPISFSPLVHQEHAGELQVSYDPGLDEDDVLIWRYPVRGLAEVQHMGVLYRFNGKARVPMDEEVQVQLPGLGRLRDGETFSHELEIAGEGGAALAKAIKVVPVKTVLHSPTDKLVYRMQLTPAAAISRNVTFIVRMASGGRWRFDVRLEVAPPDVVDTIEIETTVGQIKSAPVWLFSPSATEPMPFTAMLSHDSATELTIEPTEGFLPVRMAEDMMQGEGRDPSRAPLRVVFAPLMYGTRKTGRLVVQAGADQYTYNIVGKLSSETMRRKKIQSTIQTSLQDAPPKAVAIRQSKDMDGAGAATFARRQKNFVASNLRSVARASIFAGRTTGGEREGRKSTFEREARKSGYERFSATEDDRGLLGSARNTQNEESPNRGSGGQAVRLPTIVGPRGGIKGRTSGQGDGASKPKVFGGFKEPEKMDKGSSSAIMQMRQRMQTVGFL